MTQFYVDDIGNVIKLNCKDDESNTILDLTTALITKIFIKKPNGDIIEREAEVISINNENKGLRYVIQEGDLDIPGTYKIQPYVEFENAKIRGKTNEFIVYNYFDEE